MPDNGTEYREKYTQIMQVPAPDDLINSWYTAATVKISGACELLRGTLLMSSGSNEFVAATNEGLSSASELAILSEDLTLEAGEVAYKSAYFSGEFLGTRVVLSWETESDSHAELIESIKPSLRKHKLIVR